MLSGGIDLGGTKIQAVVVDEQHAVLGQARSATPTKGGPAGVAAAMAAALGEAAAAAGLEPAQLTHVGVGWRAGPSTAWASSVTTAWIFVPPRSIPPYRAIAADGPTPIR